MTLSVCIPVYNGAESIGPLVEEVGRTLSGIDHEVILVNDGSSDNSDVVCREITKSRSNVTYICLRRNFGEHNAVLCALTFCKGDFAAIIDDDFQNPPAEIVTLLNEAKKGYDVVYSKYHKKKHSPLRNLGSWFTNRVATALIRKPKNLYLSSFKVIARPLIEEITKYHGPFPYIDGLILRATSSVSSVYVEHHQRSGGRSNYNLARLVSLWLNMFVNFSIRPLRMISVLGISASCISLVLAVMFLIEKIRDPGTPAGWASIAILVLFLGGIQTFSLGIIGEYIGKNYLDRNGTPQWTIKTIVRSCAESSTKSSASTSSAR
jgi:glycosyltransferase involved in cell wall biosynthesis